VKERVDAWLGAVGLPAGVMACVVRFPDQTILVRILSDVVLPAALENASRCAGDVFRVLKVHRLPSVRLRWGFEGGVLHCARRPDDVVLAVLTETAADAEALLMDFLAVQG
jgi:hypothetical protein